MPSPLSPTDAKNHYWTAEVNDVVGGFIVTNAKRPLSLHGLHEPAAEAPNSCERCGAKFASAESAAPCKAQYVIAETTTEKDAIIIASTLNRAGVRRPC